MGAGGLEDWTRAKGPARFPDHRRPDEQRRSPFRCDFLLWKRLSLDPTVWYLAWQMSSACRLV